MYDMYGSMILRMLTSTTLTLAQQIVARLLAKRRSLRRVPCFRNQLRPVHLLRVFLLRVLESNFPGDPLSNSTDMRIPTP